MIIDYLKRFFSVFLMLLILLPGCGKKEEEEKKPKTFEDIIAEVVVKPEQKEEQAPEKKERALKIGVVAPETGEESLIGKMTVEGVKMAAEDFNSNGGINGSKIEIVFKDNKSEQTATDDAVNQLISDDVVAIIGAPTGWATFAPVHFANDSGTIFISAGTRRHIGRSGPFVFRFSLPGRKAAEDLIKYCVDKEGMKDFALVTVMEDEALSISSFFRMAAQKWGANIKSQASIFGGSDIAQAVADVKKGQPQDAVIFAGSASMAVAFVKEAEKQGLKLPIIGGEELYTKEFLKGGDAVVGSIVYSGFSPDDKTEITKKFVEAYRKKKGEKPSIFVAEAYDAFMLLASILKDSGSTVPETVRERMMAVKDLDGVTGRISMDKRGEIIRSPYILKVVKDGKGRTFRIVRTPHG